MGSIYQIGKQRAYPLISHGEVIVNHDSQSINLLEIRLQYISLSYVFLEIPLIIL